MNYAREMGLGEKTGANVPFEYAGSLPAEKTGFALNRMFSYADDFEVTALQLGTMVSAMANGGKLLVPYVPRTAEEQATRQDQSSPQAGCQSRELASHGSGNDWCSELWFGQEGLRSTADRGRQDRNLYWSGSLGWIVHFLRTSCKSATGSGCNHARHRRSPSSSRRRSRPNLSRSESPFWYSDPSASGYDRAGQRLQGCCPERRSERRRRRSRCDRGC